MGGSDIPIETIRQIKEHGINDIPRARLPWFQDFFKYLIDSSPFEGNKFVAQKTASLQNFGGDGTKTELLWGMTIPKRFQKREEFGFVKQYFNYEHRGLADSCFCEAGGNLYFQFVVFFWFLDLFPDADFSKNYRNKLVELLKLIYDKKDVRYFNKIPEGEIQILSGQIDAFLEGTSSHEKMAFVWYLYYMGCFTETSIAFDWNRMDGIASTWGTKKRRFVGVLSDDRAELLLERLSKKCQFWEDPDFIPVLTDALEKRGLRYIEELSDKGSTARLYKALDPHTDEKRAIKVYMRVGKDFERDFKEIRDQLKRIKNTYFVKIISDGHFTFKGEEIYYFVEEFIDGKSLDSIPEEILLSKDYSDRIKLVYMLVNALDAIHSAYEAHNDLHEGNVLIVNDPLCLKIIDPRSSLNSPALGSPDFKDFFTLLSRFLIDREKKDLGISIAEQDSIAFGKLKEKLDSQKGGIVKSSKPQETGIVTRVLEVDEKLTLALKFRDSLERISRQETLSEDCRTFIHTNSLIIDTQMEDFYKNLEEQGNKVGKYEFQAMMRHWPSFLDAPEEMINYAKDTLPFLHLYIKFLQDRQIKKETGISSTTHIEIRDEKLSDEEIAQIIKVLRDEMRKKSSEETIRLKINAQNMSKQKIQKIILQMVSIPDPRSMNMKELPFLARLFPEGYESFWEYSDNRHDLLLSILRDGPIIGEKVDDIKRLEWHQHPELLKRDICELFGFRGVFMQYVWEKYFHTRFKFYSGDNWTFNPDECIVMLKEQKIKDEKSIDTLVESARNLWDTYNQRKIGRDFNLLSQANSLAGTIWYNTQIRNIHCVRANEPFLNKIRKEYQKEFQKRKEREDLKRLRQERQEGRTRNERRSSR